MPSKLIVTVNSSGRQAASLIRATSAVGYRVRAQIRPEDGLVARELGSLPNVEIVQGNLEDRTLINNLFKDAKLAFINTTFWGDELAIGRALANAAKKAGVSHYIYSSMPDHSSFLGFNWPQLPLWSPKFAIENYIRQLGLPATFVYTGIYNNNFTSLPYPLFCMDLQSDGSWLWKAPFHPDQPLPWLDAEHDVGPAVLQLFKDGPRKWSGQRIALAFERLTPQQVCAAFSRATQRPARYVRAPIEISVNIPTGYREQLEGIEKLFGGKEGAPYFGPDLDHSAPAEAITLWPGFRGMEEYAREVFPTEERLNGLTWMDDDDGEESEIGSLGSYGRGPF
ncbi:MAG: hypothetical protein M1814_003716 [Vezdaea aestivalis]|nr:MAG: hypothetical protein M1814_003716 [Vezdaea aestivalis]